MEVNYLDLAGECYMGSMQWQLGREMGTIPAFASSTQENQEKPGSRWPVAGHTLPGGIRTHSLSRRAAADPRLRPRGHWDRP